MANKQSKKMGRPVEEPSPEEIVKMAMQMDTGDPLPPTGIPRPPVPLPPREYVAGALVAMLSRPSNFHPHSMNKTETGMIVRLSFDLAEAMHKEERIRYADAPTKPGSN